MITDMWIFRSIGRVRLVLAAVSAAPLIGITVSACSEITSTLTSAAVRFSNSLVASADNNYNQNYSGKVEDLLIALAYDKLDLNENDAQAHGPYSGNSYPGNDPYQNQPGYGDPYQNQPGYNDPYQDPGAYPQTQPQGDPTQQVYQDPYQSQPGYNDPYQDPGAYQQTQPQGDPNQQVYEDPYQSQPGYNDPYQGQPEYSDPYSGGTQSYAPAQQPTGVGAATQTINMNVALLAQQPNASGTYGLRPIQDGDVLRDGRGNPNAGDKLKVMFSVNCACYVYVIGIDATGYVAQVFPDPASGANNPTLPGQQYLLPEGSNWWGLDEYRGIEQIYFVASYRQRTDVENIITQLVKQPRNPAGAYQPVSQAAIIPVPRGLVKTQDGSPTLVPTSYGQPYQITPQQFVTTAAGADLVITRWFRHE
jgi:hypothetical protein